MDAPRKSQRQRREEIRKKRLVRAEAARQRLAAPDVRGLGPDKPEPGARRIDGAVIADRVRLAALNNTYGELPEAYFDLGFACRDCGAEAVWTARQQRWWYEIVGASIHGRAVRCRDCRHALRRQRDNPGATRLSREVAQVRLLAEQYPGPEAWTILDAALTSKWTGVRGVAIEILGHWGTSDAMGRLWAIAKPVARASFGTAEHQDRRAVLRALSLWPSADIPEDWLEWLAEVPHGEALEVVRRLPPAMVEAHVEAALRMGDIDRLRLAIPLLQAVASPPRQDGLPQRLRDHPDAVVAAAARRAWPLADGCANK